MSKLTITGSTVDAEATVTVDRIVVDLAEIKVDDCLNESDDPEGNAHTAVREAVQAAVEQAYPGTPVEVAYDWEANDRQRHVSHVVIDTSAVPEFVAYDMHYQATLLGQEIDGVVSDAIGRCICDEIWGGAPLAV